MGYAAETKADSQSYNQDFDSNFFSLSKKVESSFDAPAAVYVISSEDIRRSGASSIPELLSMAPGIEVAQQGGGKWAIGSRGMNFQFTNKLLVLIDGKTIYTTLFAGTLWNNYDLVLDDIDRIEIIRGPGATVWGANAVNGVINIITKDATATKETNISVLTNNSQDQSYSIKTNTSISKDTALKIYGKYSTRGSLDRVSGLDNNDNYAIGSTGFKINTINNDDDKTTVQSDFRRGKVNNYFSRFPTTASPFFERRDDTLFTTGANLLVRSDKKYSEKTTFHTQAYIDYDGIDLDTITRDAYLLDLDFQSDYQANSSNQITWGLGFRDILDYITPDARLFDYRRQRKNDVDLNTFLQDKYTVIEDKLYLTFGSKFGFNNYFNPTLQPRVSFEYYNSDTETLWGAITRSVRTPSRAEQDATMRVGGTAGGFIANSFDSNLTAEDLIAYELGYRIKPRDNLLFDTSVFYNDYNRIRTLEPGIETPSGNIISYLITRNYASAKSYGLEFNSKYIAGPDWRIQGSYSLIFIDTQKESYSHDPTIEGSDKQTPKNQFKLQSFYNINEDWEFDVMVNYIDSIGIAPNVIDSYVSDRIRLGYRPTENLEISLISNNLSDSGHQEFTNSLYSDAVVVDKNILLKVDYSF
jgi:iron complex outermembrane receptor protein